MIIESQLEIKILNVRSVRCGGIVMLSPLRTHIHNNPADPDAEPWYFMNTMVDSAYISILYKDYKYLWLNDSGTVDGTIIDLSREERIAFDTAIKVFCVKKGENIPILMPNDIKLNRGLAGGNIRIDSGCSGSGYSGFPRLSLNKRSHS